MFGSVSEYNAFNNNETLHPLISVVDLSKAAPRTGNRMCFGFYTIFLKEAVCGDLTYGKVTYDYQEGTLVFFAPGQVTGIKNNEVYQPRGYALVFHADLLHGTSLGSHIHKYNFFSYATREALHVSEKEQQILLGCFHQIQYELEHAIDHHSKKLIAANIELFLDYCQRFYDRQFITRETVHKGILERFDNLLDDYFTSDKAQTIGLPTVAYCAGALNLSPNYFGDLIRKELGKSAQEYIQSKILQMAKDKIVDQNKSVSQVAYELGFKYTAHFSRLFKQKVGFTPNEYRALN